MAPTTEAATAISFTVVLLFLYLKLWLQKRKIRRNEQILEIFTEFEEKRLQRQQRKVLLFQNSTNQHQLLLNIKRNTRPKQQHRFWIKESCRSQGWSAKLLSDSWLDEDYVANLRVSKSIFNQMCAELRHHMETADTNKRKAIPVKIKIASSLYYLAENCSLRTISNLFGIGKESVRRNMYLFCEVLIKYYLPRYIVRPDKEALKAKADYFETKFRIPNCVGAIDGCHIPIICPDDDKWTDYFCRKQFYSIVLQGIVDGNGLFWYVNVGWPGACHDARVFQTSSIFKHVTAGGFLPDSQLYINDVHIPYYILGDGAYPSLEWLMKPFKEVNTLTAEQSKYNELMSGMRVVVEHAFGRYKGRWRRLLKRCDLGLPNTKNVIVTCCILHNMCESQGVAFMQELVNDDDKPSFQPITNVHNHNTKTYL